MTSLFPHEALQQVHGFEFLTYFKNGNPLQPLIVFFPGWSHLARIAYGEDSMIPSEESLAHAFQEQGYSFLAISYPLENAVYPTIYPQLRITDWAQGAAFITEKIFHQFQYPSVIAVHWSASGHLMTSYKTAVRALGLPHSFSLSLEATPPLLMSPDRTQIAEILDNGLASIKKLYPYWLEELQAMLGKKLDLTYYEETYLGAIPVSLLGASLVYRNGRIQEDLASSMEDRQVSHYAASPLVISVSGNSQQAPYHPLIDRASWSFINERKIYHGYLAPFFSTLQQFSDTQWQELQDLIENFSKKMIYSLEGNHFLFIGKHRAQRIIQIMQEAGKEIFEFKKSLAFFLHTSIEQFD